MKITVLQWNIGGGKIRKETSPADIPASYSEDGLDYIKAYVNKLKPDIVTLQETHSKDGLSQVEQIANTLGYDNFVNDIYADSHVEDGFELGQGVISKFPITKHEFELFLNPHYEAEWPGDGKVISHDKGVTRCTVKIDGKIMLIQTLHAVPFRPFNIDPMSDEAKTVRDDMNVKLASNAPLLLTQGDFNYNEKSLKEFLPSIFDPPAQEAIQESPTTPKGRYYDHVVYRGMELVSTESDSSALTDHYPVITRLKVKEIQ